MADTAPPVALVGLHGGHCFGLPAQRAIAGSSVVVGARRHLEAVAVPEAAAVVELEGGLGAVLDRVAALRRQGERVCVLVSGDPGFFGLTRLAAARLGPSAIEVHPAPSSVAMAFARKATNWDDAVVVSAHGRHPGAAVEAVMTRPKVAVLCSPANPPEALGRALTAAGCTERSVTVASDLGGPSEHVWDGTVDLLAGGAFDPLSVVLFRAPAPDTGAGISWGRPDESYAHRGGMITKSEIRAVALGKLSIPAAGVMWDIGAGSGSVSAECAGLAPGLQIYAVERAAADLPLLRSNLVATSVHVVEGAAPDALRDLPDPDRVFIGGGGLSVLDAALQRLRPGGTVVATYASPERASAAAGRLGSMVQVSVNRAVPIGTDGSLRLAAENPVFICWGSAG